MIKIGIIGYGAWVKAAYIPALKRDGRAEIVETKKPSYANADVVAKLHLIGMATEESKDTGQWANVKELPARD